MELKQIKIFCKNTGISKFYPVGISAKQILCDQNISNKDDMVIAKINNKCEPLDFEFFKPKDVEFVDLHDNSGRRAYILTLCMVMAKAIHDLFPKAVLHIEHPIANGYFCNITNFGDKMINDDIVGRIKLRMQEIIARDYPVIKHEEKKADVIKIFQENGDYDKVMLLKSLNVCYCYYYEIDGYFDFYTHTLIESTGKLGLFDIIKYHHGIFMQVPSKNDPAKLYEFNDQPKMYEVFKKNVEIGNILKVGNVGQLNKANKERQLYNLIKIAEALHEKEIVRIADKIAERKEISKFVMIAGPSSSGKTTFSKRLSVQLLASGIKPIIISLDNYFIDREHTPRDENGEYDFESLYALDIDFFNTQLNELLEGKTINLPTYSFETGKRTFKGEKVKLDDDNIVMMEGIHALNPDLTPTISEEQKFKIYVSALTTISLDNHNWISTTDNRLIRRIVRDYKYRGNSVQDTISRWPSVRRGEKKWIFPFQENADVMFNSALIFELSALRSVVMPMLQEVPKDCDEYTEAKRLMTFMNYILPTSNRDIPSTSLLREFLGGSSFKY